MRFHRLDLIKYGKFSDRTVDFPVAKHDFHLIIGPNEAGKSTLRSAIVDLLFGIPSRSPLSFLHPLSELRLGAHISNASAELEFHRAKAQKQTLRTPLDTVLPDIALTPFLGSADKHFFDQMFGLDHTRLVSGGNSILNAENDVGQILFQSAAGVASLGKIRDALVAEADKLWAPRKSNDRAYYLAANQLEKATSDLKAATVRTKIWADADSKVEALQIALNGERDQHQQLQTQRSSLERIRRLAPFLTTLRDSETKRSELGEVIELATDANAILVTAERDLAIAESRLLLRKADVEKTTTHLATIQVDEALLGLANDISALDKLRLQYSAYSRDIDRRKKEIALLWGDICDFCVQLGWTCDSESSVAQQLPTYLVQRELIQLIRDHGGIIEVLRAAEQASRTKQSEIDGLAKQLSELQSGEVSPVLRAALATAKSLGDTVALMQNKQAGLSSAKITLEALLQDLGSWRKALPELIELQIPSQETLSRLLQDRQALVADKKAEATQLKNQKTTVAQLELKLSQFKELHHPTTHDDVTQARHERDESWLAIKTGEQSLQQEGITFEAALLNADKVADSLLDNVEDVTELQSLRHQLEKELLTLASLEAQCSNLDAAILSFDESWAQKAATLNVQAMPLENMGAWMNKREKALAAAFVYQESQNSLDALCLAVSESSLSLAKALQASSLSVNNEDNLAVLCVQAEGFIKTLDAAKVRHETLTAQWLAAQTLVNSLAHTLADAKTAEHRWTKAWLIALEKAGLSASGDMGSVEGALELISQIAEKLKKIKQIQVERIDAMNLDLKAFSVEALRLMQVLAPELNAETAEQISQKLSSRLASTQEAFVERTRLRSALQEANAQLLEATESKHTATASLKPLMDRAGLSNPALLADAIKRSDMQRQLNVDISHVQTTVLNGGDGLTRLQIEAEIDATDLLLLNSDLAKINDQLADAVSRQNILSADYADATRALLEIGGSDVASKAEAQRQEALAQMSDVAERYIKVFTAERLLRWSIDRYREEKQGPLLNRASTIFSTLTSGAFRKLYVDFDRQPMALEGLRSDGNQVGISGLSDGTRDQLYLALRLAALEMHLEQAMPLPFIADDLFINYDDVRSSAGFEALKTLSEQTQVIFLSHHDHLIPTVQAVFGEKVNIVYL